MGTCGYGKKKKKIQDAMKMIKICDSVIIPVVLKVWSRNPGEFQTISGGPQCQNNDHNNTKTLFPFFILSLFQGYSGVFQRLHDIWYGNVVNSEADMRIQLSLLS